MEAVGLVVMAVVSGAALVIEPATADVIKDAYKSLRTLIKRRWQHIAIEAVEQSPRSEVQAAALKESLVKAEVYKDEEIVAQAKAVIAAVRANAAEAATRAGIRIAELDAWNNITITDLMTRGNIELRDMTARNGDITVSEINTANPSGR